MTEQNGNKKVYEFLLGDYLVVEIDVDEYVWNPKTSEAWVRIYNAVSETEFKGKRYLWNVGPKHYFGGKRIPYVYRGNIREGAYVLFKFYTGSWKNPHRRFLALFRVANVGDNTVELVNDVRGEKCNISVKNLVLVKDLNDVDWTQLKNEVLNAGYEVSSKYEVTNVASYLVLKYAILQQKVEEKEEKDASSDEVSEEEALAGWEEVSGVPVMEEETTEEEKVEEEEKTEEEKEERVEVTEEEIEKIVMKHGLMKVKLVVFNLPSEYKGSRVQFDMTNRHAIIRFSDEIDITKIRTLRRAFYRILNEMAWKSLVGWVLMRDANMARLNEVIKALNEELKTERAIYIVESYFPRKVLEEWLADYIVEVKMRIDEIKQKIEEKAEELKTVRRLKSELKKMEELLKRLENEMRLLQSPQ
ncbi:MAG: hypothetical protein ACTSXX_13340 [Candidatus Baldrarchaeia archaeon]